MSKFLIAAIATLMISAAGCQNDDKHHGSDHKGSSMKASADACAHCPGVQTANADGKCPVCTAKK
jgi:hypothetical protein